MAEAVTLSKSTTEDQIERLLNSVATIPIAATSSDFIAKQKFVCDVSKDAKVKIGDLSDNFTNWFLAGDGKIEKPTGEQTLCYSDLRKKSVNDPIITELGGEEKAETSLTELFSLLEKQGNGEEGALFTKNSAVNIFYIKDMQGVLRTVCVLWFNVGWEDVGWYVGAREVSRPVEWGGSYRVFSRNSVLKTSEAQKK